MRCLLPAILLAAVLLPAPASADGYDPMSTRGDATGTAIQYQPATSNLTEGIRLFEGVGEDDTAQALLRIYPPNLDGDVAVHDIGPNASTQRLRAPSQAAAWTDGSSLVADPDSGIVWKVDIGQDPATLSVFTDVGIPDDTGVPIPLCSPVAVATEMNGEQGVRAWIAEGATPHTDPIYPEFLASCGDEGGGLQMVTAGGDLAAIVPGGNWAYQLPRRPVKGLAFGEDFGDGELLAVVGESPFGDALYWPDANRGRVLRVMTGVGDFPIDNWSILREMVDLTPGEPQLGQPQYVAPLDGKRLAIAGPEGIVLMDAEGNLLDLVYSRDGTPPDGLEDALSVLGIASSTDGTTLWALFETGTWTKRLAVWDATQFLYSDDRTICVDAGADSSDCEMGGEEGCDATCPTITDAINGVLTGAQIIVAPGEYEEHLFVAAKALSLVAREPGTVRLVGSTEPAVQVYYNGPPGLTIDGFVIEGGIGLAAWEPFLNDTLGGGILVGEAALSLTRTLVTGGQATYGGGLAAVAPRELVIDGVGFAENRADWGGGLTVQGGWMHPQAPVYISYATVAKNEATYLGGALCVSSAWLHIDSTIFASNGDAPLCYLDSDFGEMAAEILFSDLWPQQDWLVEHAGDGPTINLAEQGVVGEDSINEDPLFVASEDLDFHLDDGSPCIDAGNDGNVDPDGTRSDMGMYGFHEWEPPVDDDDSVVTDDDDVVDDDDAVDDDDSGGDDDDDSAVIDGFLPSGFRCDCSTASGGSAALAGLLVVLAGLIRRRRPGA